MGAVTIKYIEVHRAVKESNRDSDWHNSDEATGEIHYLSTTIITRDYHFLLTISIDCAF